MNQFMDQSDSIKTKLGNPCCERMISDIVDALAQQSFIDDDGDYHSPGLSHDEIWAIIEKHRARSASGAPRTYPPCHHLPGQPGWRGYRNFDDNGD